MLSSALLISLRQACHAFAAVFFYRFAWRACSKKASTCSVLGARSHPTWRVTARYEVTCPATPPPNEHWIQWIHPVIAIQSVLFLSCHVKNGWDIKEHCKDWVKQKRFQNVSSIEYSQSLRTFGGSIYPIKLVINVEASAGWP